MSSSQIPKVSETWTQYSILTVIYSFWEIWVLKKKIIELIKSIGGYHKKVKGIKNVREKKKEWLKHLFFQKMTYTRSYVSSQDPM